MEARTPKWQSRDDVPPKHATKGWSPWRKNPGNEIEQRTQVDAGDYPVEQVPEQQNRPDRWEQQENLRPPPLPPQLEESIDSDKNRGSFPDAPKYGNRGPPRNMIDFEIKHPSRHDEINETRVTFEDENLYEGVPVDSTVICFFIVSKKSFFNHHREKRKSIRPG